MTARVDAKNSSAAKRGARFAQINFVAGTDCDGLREIELWLKDYLHAIAIKSGIELAITPEPRDGKIRKVFAGEDDLSFRGERDRLRIGGYIGCEFPGRQTIGAEGFVERAVGIEANDVERITRQQDLSICLNDASADR